MPFDYEANLTAISNALTQYNTTTAAVDLSSGLSRRVKNIYKTDPEIVDLRGDIYPAVFVRVNSKTEEYEFLGGTGASSARSMKMATVLYDVIAFYRKDGANSALDTALREVERLAENIEGVFQNEFTLSGTALWCNPRSTDFIGPYGGDNMWIKGIKVELEAKYQFR